MKTLITSCCLCLAMASSALAGPSFTFFFTADTHYGLDLWTDNEMRNKATIDRMNELPGTPMPANLGGVVDTPKGLLIAGDLTDTPEYQNWYGIHVGYPIFDRDGFNDDYALDGSGRLKYPVYEGYGNHDVDNTSYSYTLEGLRARNLVRQVTNVSDNGLHYSWDWEGVHLINLNIYPGMNERSGNSLQFLIEDLATYVGKGNRPVIIMQHFGFDSFSNGWWSAVEQQAFAAALDGYNILGIFHGHLHTTDHYTWNGYDVYMGSSARDGSFLVVRLEDGVMDVAARHTNRWSWTHSKTFVVPEPASLVLFVCGGIAICLGGKQGRIHPAGQFRLGLARSRFFLGNQAGP
jgi:hypothetical protein